MSSQIVIVINRQEFISGGPIVRSLLLSTARAYKLMAEAVIAHPISGSRLYRQLDNRYLAYEQFVIKKDLSYERHKRPKLNTIESLVTRSYYSLLFLIHSNVITL